MILHQGNNFETRWISVTLVESRLRNHLTQFYNSSSLWDAIAHSIHWAIASHNLQTLRTIHSNFWNAMYHWNSCRIASQKIIWTWWIILNVVHTKSSSFLHLIFSWIDFDLAWLWDDDFLLQLTNSLIRKVILLLLYWRLVHWSGSQTVNTWIEFPSLTLIIRSTLTC